MDIMFKDSYDFSNINSVEMRYSTNFGYLFNKLISSDLNFTKRTSTSTFSYTFENLRFGGPYLYVLKTPLQSCHLLMSFLCHMRRREVKPSHVFREVVLPPLLSVSPIHSVSTLLRIFSEVQLSGIVCAFFLNHGKSVLGVCFY